MNSFKAILRYSTTTVFYNAVLQLQGGAALLNFSCRFYFRFSKKSTFALMVTGIVILFLSIFPTAMQCNISSAIQLEPRVAAFMLAYFKFIPLFNLSGSFLLCNIAEFVVALLYGQTNIEECKFKIIVYSIHPLVLYPVL